MSLYNEFDPFAAAWLRELVADGLIAQGDVDGRSILDVRPADLAGRTQVHLFSGIGVWSYALRLAGWPDDRPVWTASCPCQPFSAAGKGNGFDDERHLWPAAYWLISQCLPPVIIGEQVASKAAEPWIDLVHADLEALGYAFGCVPFPAAGVGAPHIRDRAYWCAIRLADTDHDGRDQGRAGLTPAGDDGPVGDSAVGGLANAELPERRQVGFDQEDGHHGTDGGREEAHGIPGTCGEVRRPCPTNGFWRDADWLGCRDGKWRPVEPGTFPLAHGASARVGRLRGYGNALNAYQAAAFIRSVMDVLDGPRAAA